MYLKVCVRKSKKKDAVYGCVLVCDEEDIDMSSYVKILTFDSMTIIDLLNQFDSSVEDFKAIEVSPVSVYLGCIREKKPRTILSLKLC